MLVLYALLVTAGFALFVAALFPRATAKLELIAGGLALVTLVTVIVSWDRAIP